MVRNKQMRCDSNAKIPWLCDEEKEVVREDQPLFVFFVTKPKRGKNLYTSNELSTEL